MTTNNQPWTRRPALDGQCLRLGNCGCDIQGDGTIQNPVHIVYCATHNAMQGVKPKTPEASVKALIEAAQQAYDSLRADFPEFTFPHLREALAQWEIVTP